MSAPLAARREASGAAETAERFGGITLALAVEDDRWRDAGLGDVEALALRCFAAAADAAGLAADVGTEIGLTLSHDAALRVLNAKWRGKDGATNVLSFPLVDLVPGERPGPMLGDLVLAFETLAREAADEGKTFADHFRHLIVHGMLHCLGYDHETDEDAARMEALEIAILRDLGIADPYRGR